MTQARENPGADTPTMNENMPVEADAFGQWLQQVIDWPQESTSTELPIDKEIDRQIKSACERIRQATVQRLGETPYKSADVKIRYLFYIIHEGTPCVSVHYSGRADGKDMHSEFISCEMELQIRNGRLVRQPGLSLADFPGGRPSRQISPFAEVMEPVLRAQADAVLASISYPEPLSWPIWQEAETTIANHANELLSLYLQSLKDFLESGDEIKGRISNIWYTFCFEEPPEEDFAIIGVTFDVTGTPAEFLCPGVELDFKAGKFRIKDTIRLGWSGGTDYVGDADRCAMDHAVEKWVRGFPPGGAWEDARVAPPFKWQENAKDLPDGIGRVVHLTQRSHPFLGGHNRKFRIELPDGRKRVFTVAADGGSVSRTDILLIQEKGRLFVRLKDDDMTNLVVPLDSLKLCPPDEYPDGEVVLTFPE